MLWHTMVHVYVHVYKYGHIIKNDLNTSTRGHSTMVPYGTILVHVYKYNIISKTT